jgi:FAD/FMN-containing dehydrogenase/Fe-S oxidoreductase
LDIPRLRHALERQLDGEVRFDAVTRALYATDASVYQIPPIGVVVPKTREDVVRTVRIAAAHSCPITMRGGGTSQAGQAIGHGLIVDTSKYLNRLIEVNAAERWARVEPGLVLDELNAALATHGLRFAPDISTASRATVGGMMANNSAGARSVLYGKTIDHVIDQRVVLADGSEAWLRPLDADGLARALEGDTLEARGYRAVHGLARTHADEIARRYPKVLRRVGGYNLDAFTDPTGPFNLAKLIVGSEGTLAIVVEATLNLVPLPTAKAVLAIQFDDLLQGLAATPAILAHQPAAVEVMDGFILGHTKRSAALERLRQTFIQGEPAALICVELYADQADALPPRLDALERDLAARGLGSRYHRALEPSQQAAIWSLREAALGLSMAMPGDAKSLSFVEDTAVPPERLAEYIGRFLQNLRARGTSAGIYAHASVGCLHVRPVVNLKTADGVRQFEAIAQDSANLVLEFGGALSGEHGDGFVRSPFMEQMFGPIVYEAFRAVKRAFDPQGILNPGKIVDAPPIAANLRYGPAYRTASPPTFYEYGPHDGLAAAVEMCSGLGVCRKTLTGTMCPSYMATRDERDTTRGRANVLRLAMAGQLRDAGLDDQGVHGVLDLCLECRACKAECPVGVDVARFKSEFLAGYWHRHGMPLQARALGHVHRLSRWASRVAPVANRVARSAPVRWINERVLGLDRRRSLPAWTSRTLESHAASRRSNPAAPAPVVALFADTFTNYYTPEIGLAAIAVIEALGLGVALAPNVCCGRPLISQGLLDEARHLAVRTVDRLWPLVAQGRPIVFLEPSCLSAIREDVPALVRGEDHQRAAAVARQAVLFESFVEDACASGAGSLRLQAGPRRILLHGHCHQKSMGLVAPARALLGRIPGAAVVDLDAGCCGMAGSFGYTRVHFDLSRAIAERRLLPAVREMAPDSVLVASGTSCRHQVADFTGVRALHAAELLQSLLA